MTSAGTLGASFCSPRRTSATSGGSIPSWRLNICPTFIAAPFISPRVSAMRIALRTRFSVFLDLLGRARTSHVKNLIPDDGRADPSRQPTELDEASNRRCDHFVVGHSFYILRRHDRQNPQPY